MISLARKVNKNNSTTEDFRRYSSLKNIVIFQENVYTGIEENSNVVHTETEFKMNHPLLFTKTCELINEDRTLRNTELCVKIMSAYENILQDRVYDRKFISAEECLADRFCVIVKDIDYGYALSCHKSEGSTYTNVYVYERDFSKIKDIYNYRYKKQERRVKEKNQLRYVAYTRARTKLKIIKGEPQVPL